MKFATLIATVLLATAGAVAQQLDATAIIRESQQVVVNGVNETWRLQWRTAPKQVCDPSDGPPTCPCTGFAYGETGDLFLIRLRLGKEVERLHLTPLFTEWNQAVVQRWPVDYNRDFKLSERSDFANIVSNRQVVRVMRFHDYDHDGHATEFYLQTESLPCGKSTGVVVGLSSSNPRLHVFGTATNPTKPLYLQEHEWEAIRKATSGPVRVLDWPCGDHGADTQTELWLNWSATGVDGVRREYECSATGPGKKLIQQKPLSELK